MRSGHLHLAFALPLLLIAAPAAAEPKTINDCEAIQAADAYNQCLALFGPVAHEHALSAEPVGPTAGGRGRQAHVAHVGRGRWHAAARTRGAGKSVHAASRHQTRVKAAVHTGPGGRKHMQFSVVPGRNRFQ